MRNQRLNSNYSCFLSIKTCFCWTFSTALPIEKRKQQFGVNKNDFSKRESERGLIQTFCFKKVLKNSKAGMYRRQRLSYFRKIKCSHLQVIRSRFEIFWTRRENSKNLNQTRKLDRCMKYLSEILKGPKCEHKPFFIPGLLLKKHSEVEYEALTKQNRQKRDQALCFRFFTRFFINSVFWCSLWSSENGWNWQVVFRR